MARHIGEHRSTSFEEQVDILSKRYCPELLPVREAMDSRPVLLIVVFCGRLAIYLWMYSQLLICNFKGKTRIALTGSTPLYPIQNPLMIRKQQTELSNSIWDGRKKERMLISNHTTVFSKLQQEQWIILTMQAASPQITVYQASLVDGQLILFLYPCHDVVLIDDQGFKTKGWIQYAFYWVEWKALPIKVNLLMVTCDIGKQLYGLPQVDQIPTSFCQDGQHIGCAFAALLVAFCIANVPGYQNRASLYRGKGSKLVEYHGAIETLIQIWQLVVTSLLLRLGYSSMFVMPYNNKKPELEGQFDYLDGNFMALGRAALSSQAPGCCCRRRKGYLPDFLQDFGDILLGVALMSQHCSTSMIGISRSHKQYGYRDERIL
ncbi:hypothetical protein RJ641_014233 [Dillenia turbinata]|uniref:Uncharacterized protein n=1 Tax=Dillenia turbinata TaxID=194707 RepID=A0AAN8URT8_9MAGN